jgi:hypothetical protein
MITYLYTTDYSKTKSNGGRDVDVRVYRVKYNVPSLIGSAISDTASWDGDLATARQVISDATGRKMKNSWYFEHDGDIQVIQL